MSQKPLLATKVSRCDPAVDGGGFLFCIFGRGPLPKHASGEEGRGGQCDQADVALHGGWLLKRNCKDTLTTAADAVAK
ncbi:MAG: hypothetical protein VX257_07765 [Planctomycetota bacterium]|nr:hypothetical protein [Planctomycetota bacterium]